MEKTFKEYDKQLDRKSRTINQIFDISAEINSLEKKRLKKLENGERTTNIIEKMDVLKREKESIEKIIKENQHFDLTLTKKIFAEESEELRADRKAKHMVLKEEVDKIVNEKVKEIEDFLKEVMKIYEDDFEKYAAYEEMKEILRPSNFHLTASQFQTLVPDVDLESLIDSDVIREYKFKTINA